MDGPTKGTLTDCPKLHLGDIYIPPGRARKDFDTSKLMDLAQSIKENGFHQPIVVTEEEFEGKTRIRLVAGERRVRAAAIAAASGRDDLAYVPYIWKRSLSPLMQRVVEMEENVQREDFTWQERCNVMASIQDLRQQIHGVGGQGTTKGWTAKDTAREVGVDPGWVQRQIRLAKELKERPEDAKTIEKSGMSQVAAEKFIEMKKLAETAKRHIDSGHIKVFSNFQNTDLRLWLPTIPDNSIDSWITDFPFGIPGLEESKGDAQNYTQLLTTTDNMSPSDAAKLVQDAAPQLFRTVKPGRISWFFFGWDIYESMYQALTAAGFDVMRTPMIWDKMETTAPFRGYEPSPCYEQFLCCWKPSPDNSRWRMPDPMKTIIQCKTVTKSLRLHRFQKPAELLSKLIRQSTFTGETVGDCCAGSASTLIVARQLGRSSVGCEIDTEHFLRGQMALAEEERKLTT